MTQLLHGRRVHRSMFERQSVGTRKLKAVTSGMPHACRSGDEPVDMHKYMHS